MREDYDIATDTTLTRADLRIFRTTVGDTWDLERPLYDIRYDAYWLVLRSPGAYRFTGPAALTPALLDLLPSLSEGERRAALRYLPSEYSGIDGMHPHGIEVATTREENDGA